MELGVRYLKVNLHGNWKFSLKGLVTFSTQLPFLLYLLEGSLIHVTTCSINIIVLVFQYLFQIICQYYVFNIHLLQLNSSLSVNELGGNSFNLDKRLSWFFLKTKQYVTFKRKGNKKRHFIITFSFTFHLNKEAEWAIAVDTVDMHAWWVHCEKGYSDVTIAVLSRNCGKQLTYADWLYLVIWQITRKGCQ